MFRLSGLPQIDAAEEKRRVRENVKTNVFSFVLLCAAIRLGKLMNVNASFGCSMTEYFEVIAIRTVKLSM